MSSTPGVVITPPHLIRDAIKRQVETVLLGIETGKTGALVAVATQDGVNLAVAHRFKQRWEVTAWIGKSWKGGTDLGAQVTKTW